MYLKLPERDTYILYSTIHQVELCSSCIVEFLLRVHDDIMCTFT